MLIIYFIVCKCECVCV